MDNIPMIGFAAWSGTGKTTLIEKLIGYFKGRGLRVAVIKHDGHDFSPDVPGTDSDRHRRAGAYGTAVFSQNRWMACKAQTVTERELIALFPEADLILLEGLKHSPWLKLELVRAGNSDAPVCEPATVLALVSALPLALPGKPVFHPDDLEGITAFLINYLERGTVHA